MERLSFLGLKKERELSPKFFTTGGFFARNDGKKGCFCG